MPPPEARRCLAVRATCGHAVSVAAARADEPHRRLAFLVLLVALVVPCAACSLNGEKIIKVAELPDTPDFQMNVAHSYGPGAEPTHVDIGYVYEQDSLLGCPVVNPNGRYVGYIARGGYLKLRKEEIDQLAAKANITLPDAPQLPFWDAWGGKLALLAIPSLLALTSLVDSRLRVNRAPPAEAPPEFGAHIATHRTPARPTLMLLIGYGLPATIAVFGAVSVVGLVSSGEPVLAVFVLVAFCVPIGMIYLLASAWTRGHSVALYEGGLVRMVGRETLTIPYADLLSVSLSAVRGAVSGVPVTKSYFVRFSPKYERDFSYEVHAREEFDRLVGALNARGVRIESETAR
jgi:hypothetical protein